MKHLVESNESAFESLAGEVITCFCMNYFYTGKLIGINDTCILLEKPKIIYETGSFSDTSWKDAQALPHNIFVNTASIEAFGVVK